MKEESGRLHWILTPGTCLHLNECEPWPSRPKNMGETWGQTGAHLKRGSIKASRDPAMMEPPAEICGCRKNRCLGQLDHRPAIQGTVKAGMSIMEMGGGTSARPRVVPSPRQVQALGLPTRWPPSLLCWRWGAAQPYTGVHHHHPEFLSDGKSSSLPDKRLPTDRYGGAASNNPGATGGAGVGGRPLFAAAAGSTWLERLMATYERRIWVGALGSPCWVLLFLPSRSPSTRTLGIPHQALIQHKSARIPSDFFCMQVGFRRISELTGQAGTRLPCQEIQHRGECLGLGCVYDTARGCLDARHEERRGNVGKVGQSDAHSKGGHSAEERRGQARGRAKESPGRGVAEGGCESAEMQKRRDCKANPLCVYDTAIGCYRVIHQEMRGIPGGILEEYQ